MKPKVNLAIQILPLHLPQEESYRIIDAAIAALDASGLTYRVCPFETVVEGSYEEVMTAAAAAQEACYRAGAETLLVNMKLHRSFTRDLYITDKTARYDPPGSESLP